MSKKKNRQKAHNPQQLGMTPEEAKGLFHALAVKVLSEMSDEELVARVRGLTLECLNTCSMEEKGRVKFLEFLGACLVRVLPEQFLVDLAMHEMQNGQDIEQRLKAIVFLMMPFLMSHININIKNEAVASA